MTLTTKSWLLPKKMKILEQRNSQFNNPVKLLEPSNIPSLESTMKETSAKYVDIENSMLWLTASESDGLDAMFQASQRKKLALVAMKRKNSWKKEEVCWKGS